MGTPKTRPNLKLWQLGFSTSSRSNGRLFDIERVIVAALALSVKCYTNGSSLGDSSNLPFVHLVNDTFFTVCSDLCVGFL